ncbi:MAG TPA: TRAP transporter small permease [Candidatus Methylomirabilis sp.]|nr:TRAP transporter small permease [Candidatus Methylomirabilis sp.]
MDDRPIVLQRDRHLKWRAFDRLEWLLMVLCGICIGGFSFSVLCDIVTRTIRHPWLWLQETTSIFFIYGSFFGMAVATRRADHLFLTAITESLGGMKRTLAETFNRLVVLGCGLLMLTFGYTNFLHGFGSFRMPSLTPLAWWYLAVPISGLFICVFIIEQLVNGWRNGFEGEPRPEAEKEFTI